MSASPANAACYIWTGAVNSSGYGPHRRLYEKLVGPVAPGLELDHLCKVRRCVNPAHLEPVSKRENVLRSEATAAIHAAKNVCPQGHSYTGFNVRGERICQVCAREQLKAAYRRKRAREGLSVGLPNGERPHCPAGHDRQGRSHCRVCVKLRSRVAYKALKTREERMAYLAAGA